MATSNAPDATDRTRTLKPLYWIAAAAMAVALVMELLKEAPSYLKAGSQVALIVALVLLATARPAETRAKKILIYATLVAAIGLLLARFTLTIS